MDLHGRHGLDRLRLARTLGTDPSGAARLVAAVTDRWAAALDPALLAHLGPGGCAGLAGLLAERGLGPGDDAGGPPASPLRPTAIRQTRSRAKAPAPAAGRAGNRRRPPPRPPRRRATVRDLLAGAPAVLAHVDGCQMCRDRLRAMVSVRDLVVGIPLETAPARVRTVVPLSRRARRAVPAPPPIDSPSGRRSRRRPGRRVLAAAAGAALVAAAAAGVVILARRGDDGGRNDRVRALIRLPPADALDTDPATVGVPNGTFILTNRSGRTVRWQAASPVAWLTLEPAGGTLGPAGQAVVAGRLQAGAPHSGPTVVVAITGDDGSATAVTATVATSPATPAAPPLALTGPGSPSPGPGRASAAPQGGTGRTG